MIISELIDISGESYPIISYFSSVPYQDWSVFLDSLIYDIVQSINFQQGLASAEKFVVLLENYATLQASIVMITVGNQQITSYFQDITNTDGEMSIHYTKNLIIDLDANIFMIFTRKSQVKTTILKINPQNAPNFYSVWGLQENQNVRSAYSKGNAILFNSDYSALYCVTKYAFDSTANAPYKQDLVIQKIKKETGSVLWT
ncbi:UNKNOWN [Stylonychia lemnae]|uniref:Uncharacterized protein n=1 Tax=Stylonychia lemnae TaxID=5949 RepID=A0A078AZQ9_STYLE|nr:UNKNOWN [Stylonychia lemnae]|eukprot:CDW87699.1 UNKNOWN [Stylonychia lemnae]